jgi:hypothetical protein
VGRIEATLMARLRLEAMMRFMIFAAALALALVGSFQVGAQTNGVLTSSTDQSARSMSGSRPAPTGHRQPTVESVGRAQGGKGDTANSQPPRAVNLDKNLIICRGC